MKMKLIDGLVTLLEAISAGRWKILMIKSGKSKNGNEYSPAVLKRAVKKGVFDGIAAQALKFSEGSYHHLPPALRDKYPQGFADVTVGVTENAAWSDEHKGVTADLVLSDDHSWFEGLLKLGKKVASTKWGWSINGGGSYEPNSKKVKEISVLKSLDFVTHPSAGGKTLGPVTEEFALSEEDMVSLAAGLSKELPELTESKEHTMDKEKLKKLLARARELNQITEERYQELVRLVESESNDVLDKLAESLAETAESQPPETPVTPETPEVTEAPNQNEITEEAIERMVNNRLDEFKRSSDLNRALLACQLPDESKKRVRDLFEEKEAWEPQELQEALNAEQNYVAKLTGQKVSSYGISAGLNQEDKLTAGFGKTWGLDPLTEEEKTIEAIDIPGIWAVLSEGRDPSYRHWPNIPPKSNTSADLLEAAVASNTLTNVVHTIGQRWLQREYAELPNIATTIASREMALSDFKRTEQPVLGGFAKLPEITTEGAVLADAAVPGDLKTYMDPAQFGNILTITRKMMVNNDLNVIQRMLKYWAQGAVVTLEYASIYELMVANATWADGTALYHADHGNLDATINLTTDKFGVFASAESMMLAQTIDTLTTPNTELRRFKNEPYYCIVGAPSGLQAARKVLIAENIRYGTTYSLSDTATETDTEPNAYQYYLGPNHERLLQSTVITSTDVGSWWVANPATSEGLMIGYVENRRAPWMTREVANSGQGFETGGSLRYSMMFEFAVAWGHYSSTCYVDA